MNNQVKCPADSCRTCTARCHRHQEEPLPIRKALEEVRASFDFTLPSEEISVAEAYGRVTGSPCFAAFSIPPTDVCQHDGIVVNHDLVVSKEGYPVRLKKGEYQLCTMHSEIKAPYDTTIPYELFDFDGDDILVRSVPAVGGGVLKAGYNFTEGEEIVPALHRLNAANLCILRHAGVERVRVLRKPKCTIIPTGNGLVAPGTVPGPGQGVECNSLLFSTMVEQAGGSAATYPLIANSSDTIRQALLEAVKDSDFIITIGSAGTGKGKFSDFVTDAVEKLGRIILQGVQCGPGGKALFFADVQGKPVIGMPGPPHAAITQAVQFIPPFMSFYLEVPCLEHPKAKVLVPEDFKMGVGPGMNRRVHLGWNGKNYVMQGIGIGDSAENFVGCEGVLCPEKKAGPGELTDMELVYGEEYTRRKLGIQDRYYPEYSG